MRKSLLALIAFLSCTQVALGADKIIVSGASGHLGGLVVEDLLSRHVAPEDLILVSRTPGALEKYARRGASARFGDFNQPESLKAAYAGGVRMLLISINGGARRLELHKNAIDAAVAAGVRHIVYTSYVNVGRNTASMLAVDHRQTERFLRESGLLWTMLRNQIYANGLVDQAVQIVRDGRLVTSTPGARVAYVTREDCAAAAAAVLASPVGRENRAYNITGPAAVGPRELAALASEISGKHVELLVLDGDAYRAYLRESGMSDAAIDGTLSFAKELDSPYLREPSTAVADLTGRPPTSVRELLLASSERLKEAAR